MFLEQYQVMPYQQLAILMMMMMMMMMMIVLPVQQELSLALLVVLPYKILT